MTDTPQITDIPEAVTGPKRRSFIQAVWIIPIIAAIIGISLAVKSYTDQGPIITITFKSGEGMEAGRTKIKYKEVQIGEVKNIVIAEDHSHVIVTAELTREAKGFAVKDSRFWVVRARISGGTVSGLGTLMGGSYIGVDAGKSMEWRDDFVGLERPPVVTMDVPGQSFVLHAKDMGSLDIASPVYYHRMQVGEVTGYELDKDGNELTINIFVRAPYDKFVKTNTFFWNAGGVNLSLDGNGLKINTESMAAILLGGISFQSMDERADALPVPSSSTFILYANKEEAMKRPESVVETYVLVFKESVRGLQVGAPVDLRGVAVGEVTKINLDLDSTTKEFTVPVEVEFYPERLRASYRHKSRKDVSMDSRELLNTLVEHGFRAQLRGGNLLTGQLFVALDFFPKSPPANMEWGKKPPEFPTITGNLGQLQETLMQIARKIEKLPLEELSGDVRQTIRSLDSTLKSADKLIKNMDDAVVPEAKSVLGDVRKTLDDARKTLSGANQALSADAPLQNEIRDTMREMRRAAESLRVLGDYLDRHPESLIRGKAEDNK